MLLLLLLCTDTDACRAIPPRGRVCTHSLTQTTHTTTASFPPSITSPLVAAHPIELHTG